MQQNATKPNEILHLDFRCIGLSRDGEYHYILLFKGDLSGYLRLVPCRTSDVAATSDVRMCLFAVFSVVLLWISGRRIHFNSKVGRQEQKELKASHSYTTANCPWSNGTIESIFNQIFFIFRAVLSELKMNADEWPEVVNLVQSVLINTLSARLNKRTPVKVFAGNTETTPLMMMLKEGLLVKATLDFVKAQKLMEVEMLSEAIRRFTHRWQRKLRVISKMLFRITTTRRTCVRKTSKLATTFLS
jgi:transposase InsO family protein